MDDERLEWALRRLPGVLACSLDEGSATLLLDPHASVIDIEASANALLLGSGDTRPPLLLGGTRPVIPAGRTRFDVVPIVKAAAPGAMAIGAAALVATLIASPSAFWRDIVTPTASSSDPSALDSAASPARPTTQDSRADFAFTRSTLPDDQIAGLVLDPQPASASAAVQAAVSVPAPAVRQLVLLVPTLPPAPNLTASAPAPAKAPVPAQPAAPIPQPSDGPVSTPPPAQDGVKPVATSRHPERPGRSGWEREERDDKQKHKKQKDRPKLDRSRGRSEWAAERRAEKRAGLALAAKARSHGGDDDD